MTKNYTKAMVGYAIWVEIEETLRNWLSEKIIVIYGGKWSDQFPRGIWNKIVTRYNDHVNLQDTSKARDLLEHSDFPDLFDILKYKRQATNFLTNDIIVELDYYKDKLYHLRNILAHKPYSFNMRHLDDIEECAEWILKFTKSHSMRLKQVLEAVRTNPQNVAIAIPDNFALSVSPAHQSKTINNLPAIDYESDGGFIGRKKEAKDIKRRILDLRIHPIITVAGAGGVGKTALAHHICEEILLENQETFESLIWISAKKDKLTVTGIEDIEPDVTNFEELVDAILNTFDLKELVNDSLSEKEEFVTQLIFDTHEKGKGVLLVVDNLETISHDEKLIEFLKDIPLPNKVLITSRLGLGETERRIPLREMTPGDARELFRTIAVEKSAKNLASQPNSVIDKYTERMSGYPLVIKWVVGQAALGRDIERIVSSINSTDSEIAQFCFDYIYDERLSEQAKKLLHCLAQNEKELPQAVLMHVTSMDSDAFEDTVRELELASLLLPFREPDPENDRIVTKYGILPLTKAYLSTKPEKYKSEIKSKIQNVQELIEEGQRAVRQFQFSLQYLGAETDEEKIAAKYIQTAYHYAQTNAYSDAVVQLERAKDIAPNFASLYRNWAKIEADFENPETAASLFEKAVSLNPSDATAWYHWGEMERQNLNYDNARKYLGKALELVEDKVDVLISLGNVEKQDMQFNHAINFFNEAIEHYHQKENSLTNKGEIIALTSKADTYRRWGETYKRNNQIDRAIEVTNNGLSVMQEVLDIDSFDTKATETFMKILLQKGKLYKRIGDFNSSRSALVEIFERQPTTYKQRQIFVQSCYYLVPMYLELGDYQKARNIFENGKLYATGNEGQIKFDRLEKLFQEQERLTGRFTKIFEDNGYGFISCNEMETDIFAHISEFVEDVDNSDFATMHSKTVKFCLSENDKGYVANLIYIVD